MKRPTLRDHAAILLPKLTDKGRAEPACVMFKPDDGEWDYAIVPMRKEPAAFDWAPKSIAPENRS